jgi:hypothetical protein
MPKSAEAALAGEPATRPPGAAPSATQVQLKKTEFLRGMAQLSNRPIEFYGLVIDQDSNPVPGVTVTLSVRVTKEPTPGVIGDSFDYLVVTTDARGRFAITDTKGALLSVRSLEKPGYDASKKGLNQAYWYWRSPDMTFTPDREKPEVFRMWRKAGAVRLVRKTISSNLRFDGTPSIFDVVAGQVGGHGDLRVLLARNPQQIVFGQRNYEWTLTIEALNGGITEPTDEQMYLAPAEGYQPQLVIHMPANDPKWTDEKAFNLYAKLRGGQQYARLELKALVGSDRETTPFYVTSFVNPEGGRNLEYDPLQDVVPSARSHAPGNTPQR